MFSTIPMEYIVYCSGISLCTCSALYRWKHPNIWIQSEQRFLKEQIWGQITFENKDLLLKDLKLNTIKDIFKKNHTVPQKIKISLIVYNLGFHVLFLKTDYFQLWVFYKVNKTKHFSSSKTTLFSTFVIKGFKGTVVNRIVLP